jgi:hypothetical protein
MPSREEDLLLLDEFADVDCHNDDGNHEWYTCQFCTARHYLNEIGELIDEAKEAVGKAGTRHRREKSETFRRPSPEAVRQKRLEGEQEVARALREFAKKCPRPDTKWLNRVIDK